MSKFVETGILKRVLDPKGGVSRSGKEWRTQEFVIEVDGNTNYPKYNNFQLFNDKISLINELTIGMEITVHFNIQSKEWEGRFFPSLTAWKIENGGQQASSQPNVQQNTQQPQAEIVENDDLPF